MFSKFACLVFLFVFIISIEGVVPKKKKVDVAAGGAISKKVISNVELLKPKCSSHKTCFIGDEEVGCCIHGSCFKYFDEPCHSHSDCVSGNCTAIKKGEILKCQLARNYITCCNNDDCSDGNCSNNLCISDKKK